MAYLSLSLSLSWIQLWISLTVTGINTELVNRWTQKDSIFQWFTWREEKTWQKLLANDILSLSASGYQNKLDLLSFLGDHLLVFSYFILRKLKVSVFGISFLTSGIQISFHFLGVLCLNDYHLDKWERKCFWKSTVDGCCSVWLIKVYII